MLGGLMGKVEVWEKRLMSLWADVREVLKRAKTLEDKTEDVLNRVVELEKRLQECLDGGKKRKKQ